MSLGTLTARVALDTSPLSAGVKAAALGFGLVAAGAAAAIYKVGSAYQDSLNTFQAVSSASAAQMKAVAAEAKKLGADMQLPATSAADAAKAMTELAKSGLSVDEALAAAKGTLQLAAAAQVDEAKAAETTANALNAFGLKGTEAGRVADILAASANASSAEITDMADALKMSSAVAAAAHIPIEDLAAALGELANKGIKGSDAGTSVKQMLLSLEGPSKKAAKVMSAYGIDIYTADGRMKSLRDIIANVSGALGGLSDEQRNAALATIFGSDAVRAANIVLLGGVDAFDQMKSAVTKNGAAADVAAAKTKGLRGAFEGLKSQLEGVAISIYEKASPGIERFVRSVAEGIPKAVALLTAGGKAFRSALSGEGVTSDGFVGVMERIGVASRQVVDTVREHWPVVKAAVIGAVEAIVGWVHEHWPEIRKIVVETMTTVRTVIAGVVDTVQTIWANFGEQIKGVVAAVWPAVRGIIEGTLQIVRGIVQTFTGLIHGDWSRAWDGIKTVLAGAWEALVGRLKLDLAVLKGVVSIGMEIVASVFSGAWDLIRAAFREGTAFIVDKFLAAVEWITRAAATAFGWVPGVGDKLRSAAREVEAFRDDVNASLRGIDEQKTIRINLIEAVSRENNVNTGTAGDPSFNNGEPSGGAAGDYMGGVIRRAAGGIRRAASGVGAMAPGGGRPHGPTLVSEAGYDEWVITPDPLYRLRNLRLLNQANQALGVGGGGATSAPFDYAALAAAMAPVLAAAVAANPIRASVSASAVAEGLNRMRPR